MRQVRIGQPSADSGRGRAAVQGREKQPMLSRAGEVGIRRPTHQRGQHRCSGRRTSGVILPLLNRPMPQEAQLHVNGESWDVIHRCARDRCRQFICPPVMLMRAPSNRLPGRPETGYESKTALLDCALSIVIQAEAVACTAQCSWWPREWCARVCTSGQRSPGADAQRRGL
jgi:hypothetical protein